MFGSVTFHVFAAASLTTLAAVQGTTRFIGYVDAATQRDVPLQSYVHGNLTHLVVTNAVKVDSSGAIHFRPVQHPSERSGEDLLTELALVPNVRLVVGIRGHPDDVALDELAEVGEARERFVSSAAQLLQKLGAGGLEIEWHSDDIAGGKPTAAPFDAMEQYHFALLCRDLKKAVADSDGTLSVAVRPGRQEFADGNFVRQFVDWLALRAYSMRSLGDPHHASLKDMTAALDEWSAKGVPKSQLVLSTPLFGRPGAPLLRGGDRNEALRASWQEIARNGLRPTGGDMRGDIFLDAATGKQWWVSGINTTRAKVKHILENSYGGVAFRDLHHDAEDKDISLVEAAFDAVREHRQAQRKQPFLLPGVVLFQKGLTASRTQPDLAHPRGEL